MSEYDPKRIEPKWQKIWREKGIHDPDFSAAKKPFYNLMMFPYPSAEGLHAGNMYAFTGADIYGRFKRMQGNDVFEPIGLDGFGIHSENYALKIGEHPMELAKVTEERFYKQLEAIGNGYAWRSKLETYDPEYYKWTQWIFTKLFERGLAYKKTALVNWCPFDLTVLADEQVIGGKCERCGHEVEKKELEQWFFKITEYADRLLANLENLDWSERVKIAQKNWIGRSEGAEISFKLSNGESITVFTTRPDTIFGATFLAVAPEVAKKLVGNDFGITTAAEQENKEKLGADTGLKAINPATKKEIPVWVVNYVSAEYGTGAIMGVPAHDERDHDFAKKYNLAVQPVIEATYTQTTEPGIFRPDEPVAHTEGVIAIVKHWKEDKYLALKWKQVAWGTFVTGNMDPGESPEETAKRELKEEIGYTNARFVKEFGIVYGKFYHVPKKTNKVVRAHVVYFELENDEKVDVAVEENEKHEVLWLTKEELKRFLTPDTHLHSLGWLAGDNTIWTGHGTLVHSGEFDGKDSEAARDEIIVFVGGKKKTIYRLRDWLISRQRYWGPPIPIIYCEKCGAVPVPESGLPVVLPYVKDFRPTGTGQSPLASVEEFYHVSCPKCGGEGRRETDVSDTFLDSAWYFYRYLDAHNSNEAFDAARIKKWLPVDMYIGGAEHSVLHLLYTRFMTMVFKDMGLVDFEEPFKKFRAHGLIIRDGAKMSKSKGNVVNPDEYLERFGADVLRTYLMFLAPFEQGGDFRDDGIAGVVRFFERLWKLVLEKQFSEKPSPELEREVHATIAKVTADIENLHYNTVISALMTLLNAMQKDAPDAGSVKAVIKLLNPFAPHLAHELWEMMGEETVLDTAPWPSFDESKLKKVSATYAVQIGGKTRATFEASTSLDEEGVKTLALGLPETQKWLNGATPKKVIVVLGKIVNIVL